HWNTRANLEPLRAEVERLEAENQRLREAVAKGITDLTMLRALNVVDGGVFIGLEGGASRLLAEAFAEQFIGSGAVNYLEVAFNHAAIGKLTVTMQRAEGLTPADKVRAAEARAERLAEALRDAATSMQTIADKAGRDEYMMTMDEVRGYANSRANAARAALEQEARNG